MTSAPRNPCAYAPLDRVLEPRGRERILAADVEEALLGAGREPGDRQRLDDRERILLHQHAVLERAGLGLVGVADEVVRPDGLLATASHFTPGGERRAAPPEELRVLDLADHALGTELDRPPQRLVAAVRPIVVERRRIDDADPRGATGASRASLGLRRDVPCLRTAHRRPRPAVEERIETLDRDRAERDVARRPEPLERAPPARARTSRGTGSACTCSEPASAGATSSIRRLARPSTLHAMSSHTWTHRRRPWFDREHRVEGRDAVGLGGRHRQPLADVAQAAGADPPRARLQRVQRRGAAGAAARAPRGRRERRGPRASIVRSPPRPARGRRCRGPRRRRRVRRRVASASGRTRSTAALRPHRLGDLLDPDRARLELGRPGLRIGGVDRQHVGVDLVGEVQRHEREPGPQAAVDAHRDLERPAPRGHPARPHPRPRRAVRASSGDTSIVSPRRSGDVYPPVCTPVLYESSRRPVVRRSGNSSVSSSTGGSNGVTLNGAFGPALVAVLLPQPRVQEQRARVLLVGARPLDPARAPRAARRSCRRASARATAARPRPSAA